ncbi:MAG: tetratricopeptide repeat protein [Pyrinomonadaceae bacterium]
MFSWIRRVNLPNGIGSVIAALTIVFVLAVHASAQEGGVDPAADAVALFQKGQDAHEKGDLPAAIGFYDKAIELITEFPEAEYQRGHALLALGKKDEAEKSFRRAVEIRPDWTLALANLGSLLVGKGKYDEADKLLTKAISLDDQNALAYSALTELRLSTKSSQSDLKALLLRLTALSEKANPTASAWAARGALEAALGERSAARSSFERAIEIDPKNQFALTAKANSRLDEGDTKGAVPLVVKLEGIAPTDPSVKALRARLLFDSGKAKQAVAHLDTIQDPPPDVVALRDRMVLTSTESIPDLEKKLEKNVNDVWILGRLCSLYRRSDPAKAIDRCSRAVEADPSNIHHAIGFAAALVQAKQYERAVVVLRQLQRVSPENVTIRANLGTALFQLKRYAEAKAEYRWITEKQPSLAIAYYFLGIAHDQLEEYADAMANYQLFLRYADGEANKLEIEKVNLRMPVLQKQIKEGKGKRT